MRNFILVGEMKRIITIIIVCLFVAGSLLSILILQSPPFTSPWSIEVVDDSPKVGEGSSIAIDSFDRPHISYYDGQFTHQKYAYWDGESWNYEIVDYEMWTGDKSIIRIDDNDVVHIISNHNEDITLKYYRLIEGNWTYDYLSRGGFRYSMELNQDGNPQVFFYSQGFSSVYSFNDTDLVNLLYLPDPNYPSPSMPYWTNWGSITVDNEDNLHISFQKTTGYYTGYSELKYGYLIDDQWNFETIDNISMESDYLRHTMTKIKLDSTGSPHICYFDESADALKHAYKVGSEWVIESIANGSAYDISMAIDSNDKIYLSYFNTSGKDLMVSQKDGDNWYTIALDKGGIVGKSTSIAIDSNDCAHISYYDETNGNLKYAYRSNQNITVPLILDILIFSIIFVWVFWSRRNKVTGNQNN